MKFVTVMLVLAISAVQVALAEDKPAQDQPKAGVKWGDPNSTNAPTAPKPLEDVLNEEKDPNGKNVTVTFNLLIADPNAQGGNSVKARFVDVKPSPNVYLKKWDQKLSSVTPNSVLSVTGTLHFGACRGGTPSIRYKVKEVGGRKYNDHRHWRTDRAIYITYPVYGVKPPEAQPKDEAAEKPKEEKTEAK